jgi:GDP-4-dehydro-6-deoxy-D-mannose reductase
MRHLITGLSGFVGPHLAALFCNRGEKVAGLDLNSRPAVDILDPDAVRTALGAFEPDRIYHLAGQSQAGRSWQDPEGTFRVNVAGTVNLLRAVAEIVPRARVLLVSTSEVYGLPGRGGKLLAEEDPLEPQNPYALSKMAAELMAGLAARELDLEVVRVRPAGHLGPGQPLGFVAADLASQVVRIERGEQEPKIQVGNLYAQREFMDVRDVVRAYADLIERGRPGEVYNLAAGQVLSVRELLETMLDVAGVKAEIVTDPGRLRPHDDQALVLDASRLRRTLGWKAEIPWRQSLLDILQDWRAKR